MAELKQPVIRVSNWREHVEKAAGPEPIIPVYVFSNGRKFSEHPKQPYGKKR